MGEEIERKMEKLKLFLFNNDKNFDAWKNMGGTHTHKIYLFVIRKPKMIKLAAVLHDTHTVFKP